MSHPSQVSPRGRRALGALLLCTAIGSLAITWWLADSIHTRGASLSGEGSELLLTVAKALRIYLMPMAIAMTFLAAANLLEVWKSTRR